MGIGRIYHTISLVFYLKRQIKNIFSIYSICLSLVNMVSVSDFLFVVIASCSSMMMKFCTKKSVQYETPSVIALIESINVLLCMMADYFIFGVEFDAIRLVGFSISVCMLYLLFNKF